MGPPGGMAATAAVNLFKNGLSGKKPTPENIDELVDIAPNLIKRLEQDHAVKLQELINQDLANARSREVEIAKATGKRDTNLYIMSYMVIAGFFGTFGAVIFLTLPLAQEKIIFLLLGGLIAAFERVLQYFFGSSRGSQHKTDLLGKKL